jgi:hypothetical protein
MIPTVPTGLRLIVNRLPKAKAELAVAVAVEANALA